jgi:hypothetical protein
MKREPMALTATERAIRDREKRSRAAFAKRNRVEPKAEEPKPEPKKSTA